MAGTPTPKTQYQVANSCNEMQGREAYSFHLVYGFRESWSLQAEGGARPALKTTQSDKAPVWDPAFLRHLLSRTAERPAGIADAPDERGLPQRNVAPEMVSMEKRPRKYSMTGKRSCVVCDAPAKVVRAMPPPPPVKWFRHWSHSKCTTVLVNAVRAKNSTRCKCVTGLLIQCHKCQNGVVNCVARFFFYECLGVAVGV